jgi:hypothetical protein
MRKNVCNTIILESKNKIIGILQNVEENYIFRNSKFTITIEIVISTYRIDLFIYYLDYQNGLLYWNTIMDYTYGLPLGKKSIIKPFKNRRRKDKYE